MQQIDVDFVKAYGSKVVPTQKYLILELKNLKEPMVLAGAGGIKQNLKGDGTDVLLVQDEDAGYLGLLEIFLKSYEKRCKTPVEQMDRSQIENMVAFLNRNGMKTIKAVNQACKEEQVYLLKGRWGSLKSEEQTATFVPKGTVYEKDGNRQEATIDGALFLIDSQGSVTIGNDKSNYQPRWLGQGVRPYADLCRIFGRFANESSR